MIKGKIITNKNKKHIYKLMLMVGSINCMSKPLIEPNQLILMNF